jgi:hypothetical protein
MTDKINPFTPRTLRLENFKKLELLQLDAKVIRVSEGIWFVAG